MPHDTYNKFELLKGHTNYLLHFDSDESDFISYNAAPCRGMGKFMEGDNGSDETALRIGGL